jgi:hypothetical protein
MTLPEQSSSSSVFIEVHTAHPLFFYVLFCKSLFVFFILAIILSVFFSICGFSLPLLYLQSFRHSLKDKACLFSHGHYIIILNISSEIISPTQQFLVAAVS